MPPAESSAGSCTSTRTAQKTRGRAISVIQTPPTRSSTVLSGNRLWCVGLYESGRISWKESLRLVNRHRVPAALRHGFAGGKVHRRGLLIFIRIVLRWRIVANGCHDIGVQTRVSQRLLA